MFTSYRAVRRLGVLFGRKHGEWVAVASLPDDAPIVCEGPDRNGHVMLYDAHGNMLREDDAEYLRQNCVVRIVHGPSTEDLTF